MNSMLYVNRPAMPSLPDFKADEIEARTDGGIDAHRHGVRAGSIPGTDGMPAAMHSAAMGMTGAHGPFQFRQAVDTAQAQIGNRALMNHVGRLHGLHAHQVAGGPTGVMPGTDSGNDPLQMMWRNPGRRALSPLMSASLFRPGVAAQQRPGPGRNLSLSPRRNIWDKDILFGVDHGDTLDMAIKLEASTDSIVARHRFGYFNKRPPPGFNEAHLWDKPGYGFADRNKLKRTDLPYMAYAREAIATAMERGGNIFWALGHLDFDQVFAELFRVATEHGTDPVRYMAEVTFPELLEKHGKYIDVRTGDAVAVPRMNLSNPVDADLKAFEEFNERVMYGEVKDISTFKPLITTTEIIGFLMGDERKYLDKTSFFDASHQEADRGEFLAAFSGVLDQLLARKPEIGPDNEYKLETSVYRPLDWYTGYPCGHCSEIFRVKRELEEHWKSFPGHRP